MIMELQTHIVDIVNFLMQIGFEVEPIPKVVADNSENSKDDIFIKTGYYDSQNQTITLMVNNRHVKDILRTFCHEMVHHHQFLTMGDAYGEMDLEGSIYDNEKLKKLESEAYTKGNLLFRLYTEFKQGRIKGSQKSDLDG